MSVTENERNRRRPLYGASQHFHKSDHHNHCHQHRQLRRNRQRNAHTDPGRGVGLSGTTTPQNVTMSAPQTVTANFVLSTVSATIATSPSGLSITVDGTNYAAPQTFQWVIGSSHTIAVSSQSGGTGTQYVFVNWSDSGAQSHSVIVPSSATTYTANFTTQYFLTTAASAGGSISPASGWYNTGTVVSISATANSGFQFTGFSGDLSGTTTPQNLTMNVPHNVTANFSVKATAQFAGFDSTTTGSWHGVYGSDGYVVVGDLTSNPTYVTPVVSLENTAVYMSSTTKTTALQKPSNLSTRIAAAWYSATTFWVDLNITDSNAHRVAVYFWDADGNIRTETVSVTDASENVLNTQSPGSGDYMIWTVTGHVKLKVTLTSGSFAMISGLFFDP
jgi:hypothetical protein